MDLETIKALVEVLGQSDVEELELQTAGTHLRIRRAVGPRPAPVNGLVAEPSVETGGTPAAGAQPAAEESLAQPGEIVVTAPMVGTFYRAPAPDAPPYVEVGDTVEPGQPLCIIEAMKLMNEIEAEQRGRVRKILVANAQPVEYGQPLFVLEPL
ncbi:MULTISPECIES: acetyl-CoA carboxylase biotin carboxyl carrier protein [Limnochorda]|uniref:acetyl-CoA carboxylase biotin carboxyl carrier protein n=1 Tax=Limnochorda TaxID=1676651 RepID=UPI00185B3F9E|nr:acetyl-CoA carboxylase biotin carboxyl carrier protein [Limnochorda pilosa]MBO2487257.1 acetyl-CoA carboxylase biotin carboxyl carrier protein [Bacillota bacterium]MBO2518273.1 acetyl-CoA carboxylase biotin carboxyl carrier protein [Bacillota bacterium]NMA72273.1 acetyl-CoA carboxylase biotin carboxyl carrier protein [Bacillota bacterium]